MLKNFLKASLSCFLILFLISCEKDPTSGANVGGTSFYSFAGSPSACSPPVIAGIYSVGLPMTSANTLTFSVDVSVKGTYSMSTTSANGVWFSGGGVFPGTGNQTVVLTGNGTPAKPGSFTFVPATNNTCNFSVSFLSGAPSAVFTYSGAPANCTAPAITGIYATGIALGSGNYVDLAVNVTTPGAYTVSTNSTNGMSFSGSGSFTANGSQVVRLIGNGTPAAQGTFTFKPSNNGCNFSITVAPPPPPASFTFIGAPGNCTSPNISGAFVAGTALTSSSTIKLGVNVTVAGTYSVTTNSDNGVSFSGSGILSAGAQIITLTSTNTPTAAGQFTYTPTGGCSFDITYTGAPPPPADFLKCTIDGTFIDFNVGVTGLLASGSFSASGGFGSSSLDVTLNDMSANIAVGTYNKFSLTNTNKFCLVTYTPNTGSPGTFWLPGVMNSNPFTVTVQTITTSPNRVTGIFSGDLFDAMGANKKVVTGGSFSVSY